MLIGVHGKIHHGKDEIARYLVMNYGYRILRMSDEIKEEVLKNLRLTLIAIWEITYSAAFSMLDKDEQESQLRKLVYVTKPKIVRELLQEYGTEVRRGDDPDYWVKAWSRRALHFKLDADLLAMREVYRDRGWLDAVVELERLDEQEARLRGHLGERLAALAHQVETARETRVDRHGRGERLVAEVRAP